MNRCGASRILVLAIFLLLLPGCPEKEPVDARQALVDLAMEAREEGLQLVQEGKLGAAQETFHRAYRHALEAVRAEGAFSRPDLLNVLAELCIQLARFSPEYIGRAVRYCHMAIQVAPEWGVPYYNLGLAYQLAGMFSDSVRAFERFFELVPREHIPAGMDQGLVQSLFLQAAEIVREDRIGAEAEARRVLERAFARRSNPAGAPEVHRLLTEINERYEQAVRAAADARDGLEIVRLHARFGFPVPAETALQRYKDSSGQNRDVRFVEARFVRELAGTPESLRQAAEIYLDLMSRGELVVHAAAGYGRVMLALGEGDQALERLADFPNPTAELRRVLILLRLDRLHRVPSEDQAEADRLFSEVDELLNGGLEVTARAHLYWAAAIAALERKDADRLERTIRTYQSRFPQDPRVVVLDAELKTLRGIPVEDVFAEESND